VGAYLLGRAKSSAAARIVPALGIDRAKAARRDSAPERVVRKTSEAEPRPSGRDFASRRSKGARRAVQDATRRPSRRRLSAGARDGRGATQACGARPLAGTVSRQSTFPTVLTQPPATRRPPASTTCRPTVGEERRRRASRPISRRQPLVMISLRRADGRRIRRVRRGGDRFICALGSAAGGPSRGALPRRDLPAGRPWLAVQAALPSGGHACFVLDNVEAASHCPASDEARSAEITNCARPGPTGIGPNAELHWVPQKVHDDLERGGMMSAAWIVQMKSGNGWAPFVED